MPSQWFYSHSGQKVLGPCTSRELKALASSGQLLTTDRVRKHGMVRPVTASRVKGLFAPGSTHDKTPVFFAIPTLQLQIQALANYSI
jgi:hypothetical protein